MPAIDFSRPPRVTLAQDAVAAAARLKSRAADIAAAEERLANLRKAQADLTADLSRRRGRLSEALAAMRRIGRSPEAKRLCASEQAAAAGQAALLLAAALRSLKQEADALAADLDAAKALKGRIAADRDALAHEAATLEKERAGLGRLLTATAGRRGPSFADLLAQAEADSPDSPAWIVRLAWPAEGGRTIRRFGERDASGVAARGLFLQTPPEAPILSPCDGSVVYADWMKTYRHVLIINAGDGYHVVLAGMERIDAALGTVVLTGEPVAAMSGPSGAEASAIAPGREGPILYVELRKDGAAIDPTPYWSSKSLGKVRG